MTKEELKQKAEEYISDNCKRWETDGLTVDDIANETYLAGAEPREKRIAELEKRCANYEMNISKMEKGTCDICKETEKDKKIAELEKENAELKEWKEQTIKARGRDYMSWSRMKDQLTKAKDLLKRFIELENCTLDYDDIKEAEQFIKDSEVEK